MTSLAPTVDAAVLAVREGAVTGGGTNVDELERRGRVATCVGYWIGEARSTLACEEDEPDDCVHVR